MSISQSLAAIEGPLQANQDISGIGVRITIYVQAFINNILAFTVRNAEEAISINTLNLVVIATISLSSGFSQRPDWPHLVILYHYILLIQHSGVTYNTAQRPFRASPRFGSVMEHLSVLDLIVMPFFVMISGSLWLGLFLARERFAETECEFGNWVLFGQVVDMKKGTLIVVGYACAALLVGSSILSSIFDMTCRAAAVKRTIEAVYSYYGDDRASSPRPLPPKANIEVTGDYHSAWIWRQAERLGVELFGSKIGMRGIIICWRIFVWLYVIVTTEQIIAMNGFAEENLLTYGQTFAVILLIIPFAILWTRCYRTYPEFAKFFDSIQGQRVVWVTIGTTIGIAYAAAVYAQNEDANVQRAVWAIAILCCFLPGYIRKQCSEKLDELFGNHTYPATTSWWEVWSLQLQLRLPQSRIPESDTALGLADSAENTNHLRSNPLVVDSGKKHE